MLRKNIIPSMTKEIHSANIFILKFASLVRSDLQCATGSSLSGRKITERSISKVLSVHVGLEDDDVTFYLNIIR